MRFSHARDEDRVVAEARIAARLASDRARPLAADDDLIRAGHQRTRRDEGRATTLIGHIAQLRQQQRGVAGVVAVPPDHRAESTPGMPLSAATSNPRSSATVGNPVAANPSRALARALSSNVAPVSGASSNGGTSSSDTNVSPESEAASNTHRNSASFLGFRLAVRKAWELLHPSGALQTVACEPNGGRPVLRLRGCEFLVLQLLYKALARVATRWAILLRLAFGVGLTRWTEREMSGGLGAGRTYTADRYQRGGDHGGEVRLIRDPEMLAPY